MTTTFHVPKGVQKVFVDVYQQGAQQPLKWQPISLAPRDGAEILLARIVDGEVKEISLGSWMLFNEGSWEDPQPDYHDWGSDTGIEEPTHWIPKPGMP